MHVPVHVGLKIVGPQDQKQHVVALDHLVNRLDVGQRQDAHAEEARDRVQKAQHFNQHHAAGVVAFQDLLVPQIHHDKGDVNHGQDFPLVGLHVGHLGFHLVRNAAQLLAQWRDTHVTAFEYGHQRRVRVRAYLAGHCQLIATSLHSCHGFRCQPAAGGQHDKKILDGPQQPRVQRVQGVVPNRVKVGQYVEGAEAVAVLLQKVSPFCFCVATEPRAAEMPVVGIRPCLGRHLNVGAVWLRFRRAGLGDRHPACVALGAVLVRRVPGKPHQGPHGRRVASHQDQHRPDDAREAINLQEASIPIEACDFLRNGRH